MPHILVVGVDRALLYTRCMVLEKSGASTQNATPAEAIVLLANTAYDLLVLCHSIPDLDVPQLCRSARDHSVKILLIEAPTRTHEAAFDVDARFPLENGPELLIANVRHLLQIPGALPPAAGPVPFVRSRRPARIHKPTPDLLPQA